MSRTREQLEAWLGTLKISAERLLDVGGSQKPVLNRLGSSIVGEYKIMDLATPHETALKPDYELDLGTEWSEQYLAANVGQFDVVFCLEVFEYLIDPKTACRNLALLTKPGGTLYVTFPFVYPLHNPTREDALRYTEYGAKRILTNAGFEILETIYRTGNEVIPMYVREGMRMAREYPHHDAVAFNFVCRKV